MATSSYSNLFGTNGAGQTGSKAGIGTLFGQQERPKKKPLFGQPEGAKTFAQMQAEGQARPAQPPAPPQPPMLQQLQAQMQQPTQQLAQQPAAMAMAAPAAEPMGGGVTEAPPGSTITTTAQPGQINPYTGRIQPTPVPPITVGSSAYDELTKQLQDILNKPVGYSDEQLAQLRKTAVGGLEQKFGAARSALDEEMARRGLAASSISSGRFGDLAGQQAQALAEFEGNLLQQQLEAQMQGRGQQLTALTALTRQRADIDARAAQLMEEARLRGREMDINEARYRAEQEQAERERVLKERLGLAEFTGTIDGKETVQSRTQRQNLAIQLAQALAGSDDPEVLKGILPYIYEVFGLKMPGDKDDQDKDNQGDGQNIGGNQGPGPGNGYPINTIPTIPPLGPFNPFGGSL